MDDQYEYGVDIQFRMVQGSERYPTLSLEAETHEQADKIVEDILLKVNHPNTQGMTVQTKYGKVFLRFDEVLSAVVLPRRKAKS